MGYFNAYIYLIIAIKVLFILSAIGHIYLKEKHQENSDLDKKFLYWKERFEFIFIFLMSCLLIFVFNPRQDNSRLINSEIKILLYLFGIILLITANWGSFFKESKWFKYIQEVSGKKGE
jgi:cell division protein FtsW (lipid II flippase)